MRLRHLTIFAAMLAVLAGCSSSDKQDWNNSGGVLYPIAKIGSLFSALGDGIHSVGTPGSWSARPSLAWSEPSSGEQLAELEKYAVPVDLDDMSDSPDRNVGAGFGAMMFSNPFRSAFLFVEQTVGYRFDWYFVPQLQDIAFAKPFGVILVNPSNIADHSGYAVMFTLFHEASHHTLNHMDQQALTPGFAQQGLRTSQESEADVNGARLMIRAGYLPEQVLYGAMEIFSNNPGDSTHLPGEQRYIDVREAVLQAVAEQDQPKGKKSKSKKKSKTKIRKKN